MAGFADATKIPDEPDGGVLQGTMYHIAVLAWFRSTGNPRPMMFKFQDDMGEMQEVRNITIHYAEDKNFSGIPSKEYGCEAVVGGLIRTFKLIFYLEAGKWVMLI